MVTKKNENSNSNVETPPVNREYNLIDLEAKDLAGLGKVATAVGLPCLLYTSPSPRDRG